MQQLFITNTANQKIAVQYSIHPQSRGVAVLMHGIWSSKDSPLLQELANSVWNQSFSTISFDARHSMGSSDGDYADATTTSFYEDLQTVISRAKTQSWFQEPFSLIGHSMGALCCGLYAQNFPMQVERLILISSVINRDLSKFRYSPEVLQQRKESWSYSLNPHDPKPLKRSFIQDRMQYDLLSKINNLDMPSLVIVGDQDNRTPLNSQHILFNALPSKEKQLAIIPGARHNIKHPEHLSHLSHIISTRISNLQP